jgi:hypothetical protein
MISGAADGVADRDRGLAVRSKLAEIVVISGSPCACSSPTGVQNGVDLDRE